MRRRRKKENGISRIKELKVKIHNDEYLNFVVHRMATDIAEVLFR